MNELFKNVAGMSGMTDQVIATDFLISVKSGVKNTAFALTEAATPELRSALREQLMAAISIHEQISKYMMEKGYYHPYNLEEQAKIDLAVAQTSQNLV
ncbi:spore coat protein [Domibacillus sp. DTU_2020_1001157_1_SI_ALB_TIR_016]|uniref:spore coat protein n=1 Tax=Domibacillus sp. DTU_2020_1001157_1_SI_ALB_TIR_016 TaxID=3077789 RepID=UPI0028E49777|nr:spore coat protein [Domibacillus sp. DTU_2020_1001157_1_SI_ALB_TIR_016]WNS79560.1 spore coat protein [Domibacillus sp. DTU_2020_1001157_1_SI_ALB_TIR_016]